MTTAERDSGASVFIGRKVEKRRDASWKNPYYEQDARHPVVCVSWYDAVEYCDWRSRSEGLEPCYRGSGGKSWSRKALADVQLGRVPHRPFVRKIAYRARSRRSPACPRQGTVAGGEKKDVTDESNGAGMDHGYAGG